jgi:hypothetical protein
MTAPALPQAEGVRPPCRTPRRRGLAPASAPPPSFSRARARIACDPILGSPASGGPAGSGPARGSAAHVR